MNAESYRWNDDDERWEFEMFDGSAWCPSVWLDGRTEAEGAVMIGNDPYACVVEYVSDLEAALRASLVQP